METRRAGRQWVHGTARILGDEMTLDAGTAREYDLAADGQVLWDFVGLEDEVDAARFASRHGLLRTGTEPLREPLSGWWEERDVLRGVLLLAVDLATAEAEGPDAVRAVEHAWTRTANAQGATSNGVSALAAIESAFERVLGRARFGLRGHDRAANGRRSLFALRAHSTDLLGYIYDEAATVLSTGSAVGRCPECGRVFPVRHRRQAYCSPKHASRARFRRFQERRTVGLPALGSD